MLQVDWAGGRKSDSRETDGLKTGGLSTRTKAKSATFASRARFFFSLF
jgi:hypothetical protein